MAYDIEFQDDTFVVDFKDASERFQVTFEDSPAFAVDFTDGDTVFTVNLVDTNDFDVTFEQNTLTVLLEDSDTFAVSFADNTFDVVFTEDVFDVQFADMGVQGVKGEKGDTGSVVADFVFDDTANNDKTLGVDFTEVVSGDIATLTATVDASGLATSEQGDKADTALQSFTEVNDVVAGESSYVDAIKETADAAGAGGLSWSDVVISGLIVAKTTDDNDDKLYQMVFQSETYWRLFQTSPKANIIYKGSTFATAVEITRRG